MSDPHWDTCSDSAPVPRGLELASKPSHHAPFSPFPLIGPRAGNLCDVTRWRVSPVWIDPANMCFPHRFWIVPGVYFPSSISRPWKAPVGRRLGQRSLEFSPNTAVCAESHGKATAASHLPLPRLSCSQVCRSVPSSRLSFPVSRRSGFGITVVLPRLSLSFV